MIPDIEIIKEITRENRNYDYTTALKKLQSEFFEGVSSQAAKGRTSFEARFSSLEYSRGLGLAIDKLKREYVENGYTVEITRREENTIEKVVIRWD